MTVAEVHREFSPYQTNTGWAPGDECWLVEPDGTTDPEEHLGERQLVEEDRSMLIWSDAEEDPEDLGTLCLELNTDEQSSDECNPAGSLQSTVSTQQGPSHRIQHLQSKDHHRIQHLQSKDHHRTQCLYTTEVYRCRLYYGTCE